MSSNTTKVRIPYIDVAKGLLIITLVLHHIPYIILERNAGLHNAFVECLHEVRWYIYGPYFMSAFFLITGMCSNFKKDFKTFIQDGAVSLLIPVLVLGQGGQFWFITALFVGRLFYWVITNYISNKFVRASIIIITALLGCIANNDTLQSEPLSWQHAALAVLFLFIGNEYKAYFQKNKYLLLGSALYVALSVTLFTLNRDIPWFEAGMHVSYLTFCPFLLLAVSGSCIPLILAKHLTKVPLIEFIGKHSIVVYLTHIPIVLFLVSHLYGSILEANSNIIKSICIVGFILVATVSACTLLAKCLDNKYLRWTMGKLK